MRGWLAGYLIGWLFWLSLSLGSVALLQLHALTGGRWGRAWRGTWEAAARAMPALAVLFLPILAGVWRLYPWAAEGRGYLSAPWFAARALLYLAVWTGLAAAVARPAAGKPAFSERRPTLAGGAGLVAYFLTATFASIDWMMSLEPGWGSTVYGLSFVAGQGVSALALAALLARPGAEDDGGARRDLGNLMLAFVMLWAYCAYSQYLIVWSADLPAERGWYLARARGGWGWVAAGLAAGHFAAPFALLLFRGVKDRARTLALVAAVLLAGRGVDLWWLLAPSLSPGRVALAGAAALGLLLVGFAWTALFSRERRRRLAWEAA